MHFRDVDGDTPVLKKENVLVISIEELKEAVKDGYDEGRGTEGDMFEDVWEQFLKRKGIKL